MKESCLEDYDIKMHGGNVVTNQDYEENISKMRVAMRKKRYLTRPETDSGLFSLDDIELNPNLSNLIEIANKQRQDNILNVARHNDFSAGYKTNADFKVLKNKAKEKLGINYENQLRILIASEENAEMRENLTEYYSMAQKHPNFDEEKIVDDILAHNFSFL